MLVSSLIDRFLRNFHGPDEKLFFSYPPARKFHQVLTLFSIRRNWYHLSAPSGTEYRDLRFIQAVRTGTMFLVIFGHVCYYSEFLPSVNPEANEAVSDKRGQFQLTINWFRDLYWQFYSSIPATFIFNSFITIQTFLFISGFLMTFFFLSQRQTESSNFKLFFKTLILRYIRFAPLQAIAVLLHSTWLSRLGDGPIYNKVNYAERQFCRKHWWKNMLFIDNYTNVEEKCLLPTWFVDCDFWLGVVGIAFLLIVRKWAD